MLYHQPQRGNNSSQRQRSHEVTSRRATCIVGVPNVLRIVIEANGTQPAWCTSIIS